MVERRIAAARLLSVKILGTFDFLAMSSVNKQPTTHLAGCEFAERRDNINSMDNSYGAQDTYRAGTGARSLPEWGSHY